jgi:hypothetical protein
MSGPVLLVSRIITRCTDGVQQKGQQHREEQQPKRKQSFHNESPS